jgi:antitoxin component YwqK of YwqJK toxin-antitoxin module
MTSGQKITAGLVIFFVLLVGVNSFISKSVQDNAPVVRPPVPIQETEVQSQSTNPEVLPGLTVPAGIVRRNRVIPGDEYEESTFYRDGQVIARQRIVAGEVVDQQGVIPDGKVYVMDDYQNTRGEEFYEGGKKSGRTKLYYDNGVLKKETVYVAGEVVETKEYFNTGAIHITQDRRDARQIPGEAEIGVGKVYFPDGKVRYEWNQTRGKPQGFKKSYNGDGELVQEITLDQRGQIIEIIEKGQKVFPKS